MGLTPEQEKALEDARGALRKQLESMLEKAKPGGAEIEERDREDTAAVIDRLLSTCRQIGFAPPDDGGIERFFESVGAGVVDAQQRLDDQSLAYLAQRGAASMPTLFRIPRVTAELKFAMESSAKRALNF